MNFLLFTIAMLLPAILATLPDAWPAWLIPVGAFLAGPTAFGIVKGAIYLLNEFWEVIRRLAGWVAWWTTWSGIL